MINKILEWIDKTGYPLELFGETILFDLGFDIINSHFYKDQELNLFRELDILATHVWESDGITLSFDLLIECKKSQKPFILLSNRNRNRESIHMGEYLTLDNPHGRLVIGNNETEIKLPGNYSSGFKLIQAFVDGDEVIHKASNTLVKSYFDWMNEQQGFIESYIEQNHHKFITPMLLIDAPLFEMKLNEKNELAVEEIDCGVLEYKTFETKSPEKDFPIPIITKESFKDYLNNIINLGQNTFQFLRDNPRNNIKNFNETEMIIVPIE